MRTAVAIVATLDTKAKEIAYLKKLIVDKGCDAIVVDVGVFPQSELEPEVSRDGVAAAAEMSIAEIIDHGDRRLAVHTMREGGARILMRMYADGAFSGIVSVAGGTGTHIASGIMRALPIGVPKLMVSTVASRDVSQVVGSKDITLMHAVADIIGLNFMTKKILADAAGAIVGMVYSDREPAPDKKIVGLTSFGPLNQCAFAAQEMLDEMGYETIPFHAVGAGSMAMEDLVDQGVVQGVLDLSLHEFVDSMYGGYCRDIGPTRLVTAGRKGVAHVILPGGLDMVVFECDSLEGVPEQLRDRTFLSHDFRSFVRTGADDYRDLAKTISDRLNQAERPPTVIVPLRGWSKADAPGGPFYSPETDRIFTNELKALLAADVKVMEVDANINDEECARIAVLELHRLMEPDP